MKNDLESLAMLTDEERRAYIQKTLGHRLLQPGAFFMPTARYYDTLATNAGLHDMFKELCRWLGVKPGHTQALYGSVPSDFTVDSSGIRISNQYMDQPYAAGAQLCFATLTYVFLHHKGAAPDKNLIELASIETGLGLWIVNSLPARTSIWQSIHYVVSGDWHYRQGVTLEAYQAAQFAHIMVEWAHTNRIPIEEYLPHIRSNSRYLLPAHVSNSPQPSLPEPKQIHARRRVARIFWIKLALIVSIIAAGVSVGCYVWALQRPTVTAKQLEEQQTLHILKSSYDACMLKVTGQQNTYDPNDLMMERQIEATQSRCESLRNEYNHALDQYQKLYSET